MGNGTMFYSISILRPNDHFIIITCTFPWFEAVVTSEDKCLAQGPDKALSQFER